MKTVKEINYEYFGKFKEVMNAQNAAIVMALGVTKDGKTTICMTTDIHPERVKEILKETITKMGG